MSLEVAIIVSCAIVFMTAMSQVSLMPWCWLSFAANCTWHDFRFFDAISLICFFLCFKFRMARRCALVFSNRLVKAFVCLACFFRIQVDASFLPSLFIVDAAWFCSNSGSTSWYSFSLWKVHYTHVQSFLLALHSKDVFLLKLTVQITIRTSSDSFRGFLISDSIWDSFYIPLIIWEWLQIALFFRHVQA